MRNRTIGINVRVSENEKKKLQRNAKKSNLNLSSYLRKSLCIFVILSFISSSLI